MKTDVGIVVPTLGLRIEFLEVALKSIRKSGTAHISVVCPEGLQLESVISMGLVDSVIKDPNMGLAAAINEGIRSLPPEIQFVNWLGDDDLLEPEMLDALAMKMRASEAGFMWGQCRYIDAVGSHLFLNKSGKWAKSLIRFGPNLVPQPGALIRRSAFIEVGGIDTKYGWAFDQELFTKLIKKYKTEYFPHIVSSFRWHEGSLTAGQRSKSVEESSTIRRDHLPALLRPVSALWEIPLRVIILQAGRLVRLRGGSL
jgi:GT2 family glycosyltransferase